MIRNTFGKQYLCNTLSGKYYTAQDRMVEKRTRRPFVARTIPITSPLSAENRVQIADNG